MRLCVLAGALLVAVATGTGHARADESVRPRAPGAATSVPPAVAESIAYLRLRADGMGTRYEAQAAAWRARADTFEARAAAGHDPYAEARGQIVTRAYRSRVTGTLQGYAVYLPPGYDPAKPWPVVMVLHGGSSNGNLFLGVVLGNNMNWLKYPEYWWNEFEPVWKPDCIVVSPDGFGQVIWRWMAEQDVLDVLADVERHYRVDPRRRILAGLSNGGVGAYAIGTRHASRFSVVQAMAGAPSWLQYTGGRPREEELRVLRMVSGMDLAENVSNTDFRYYHGRTDGGPMRPAFVEAFTRRLAEVGAVAKETWYDAGHDILYMVEKHGRTFAELTANPRPEAPRKVRFVTSDYRAATQAWVTVTRIDGYPSLARVEAEAREAALTITTTRVRALEIDVEAAWPSAPERVRVTLDGAVAYEGPRAPLGHRASFVRGERGFALGFPASNTLEKRPGVSGPLPDAYRDFTVHVYGTGDPTTRDELEKAARKGAKGWPLWLWNFEQPVVADTEVTDDLASRANLVLYTTGDDHAYYRRIRDRLPIRVDGAGVALGAKRFDGSRVGTRFLYPNPLAPERYVIVQGGATTEAVRRGHNLPDFVPDYVIYDERSTATRPRLIATGKGPLAMGFFGDDWQLPGAAASRSEATSAPASNDEAASAPTAPPPLPVPAPPAVPRAPTNFLAPASDPAGKAARLIARRVASFPSYRQTIPGGQWASRPERVWRVRPEAECLAALAAAGVPHRRIEEPAEPSVPTPVPTPVIVTGPVGGVAYRILHADRELLVSCELAARLPEVSRALAKHGVRAAGVMSAYRAQPFSSFHTFGLALDLSKFWLADGTILSVEKEFIATPSARTCDAHADPTPAAKTLRAIACELAALGLFASVLTPNYNEGHRDHMHVDLRPDDPRQFLR